MPQHNEDKIDEEEEELIEIAKEERVINDLSQRNAKDMRNTIKKGKITGLKITQINTRSSLIRLSPSK